MRKKRLSIIVFVGLVISLACQTISEFSGGQQSATSQPVPITTLTDTVNNISLSSDEWIAYVNKNNVWLIHPDGSGQKQITANPDSNDDLATSEDIKLDWSPDGRKLAFMQSGVLYVLDVSTFATTKLVDNIERSFDWSKTSDQIVYDTEIIQGEKAFDFYNSGVWVVDVENGKKSVLVNTSKDVRSLTDPHISSDSNYVLFTYPGGFEPGGYGVAEIATGKFTPILEGGNATPNGCNWMPGKLLIACINDNVPQVDPELAIVDIKGNIQETYPIPKEMHGASLGPWSYDGKYVTVSYYADPLPNFNLSTGIFLLAAKKFQTLSGGRTTSWSSDSQWIVTEQLGKDIKPMQIVYISNEQVFPFVEGESPKWQPFLEDVNSSQDLAITSNTEEALQTLTPLPNIALCIDTALHMQDSPKGKFIEICADGTQYEIGPLQDGGYAMGPNKKFFVYCSNNGEVYAGRIGEKNLVLIGDVKDFSIIVRGEAPQYEFEFYGDHPYTVKVKEMILDQSKDFQIPRYITTPN